MKFTCQKDDLLKQVSTVSRLATTRATLPILQNIYLATQKSTLSVKATDLEQTLEGVVAGTIIDGGGITVPARVLVEYLQNNTDQELTLEAEDTTLHITSPNHNARIKGMPAEDYPTLPKITFREEIGIGAAELLEAITKTIFAAASDETRPILTGLLFRFQGEMLTLVGTDGYRLACASLPIKSSFTGDYILPKRSLQELLRLISNEPEVTLAFSSNQAQILVGSTIFITRILEGAFPPYESIIPKTEKISLRLSSSALLQSLKLASLFSRDSAFSTKLEITQNKIKVTAISPSLGDNSNEITVENGPSEPFTISLNARYLIDALAVTSGDITLILNDAKSSVVMKLPSNPTYLYLVMPLRSE